MEEGWSDMSSQICFPIISFINVKSIPGYFSSDSPLFFPAFAKEEFGSLLIEAMRIVSGCWTTQQTGQQTARADCGVSPPSI